MNEKQIQLKAIREAQIQALVERNEEEIIVSPEFEKATKQDIEHRNSLERKLRKSLETSSIEKVNVGGFLMSKRLVTTEKNRSCPVCNSYSFSSEDDLYMNKFECCYECYVQYVENREERWKNGWRPDENFKKKID